MSACLGCAPWDGSYVLPLVGLLRNGSFTTWLHCQDYMHNRERWTIGHFTPRRCGHRNGFPLVQKRSNIEPNTFTTAVGMSLRTMSASADTMFDNVCILFDDPNCACTPSKIAKLVCCPWTGVWLVSITILFFTISHPFPCWSHRSRLLNLK